VRIDAEVSLSFFFGQGLLKRKRGSEHNQSGRMQRRKKTEFEGEERELKRIREYRK
jgi:hypothetical protein